MTANLSEAIKFSLWRDVHRLPGVLVRRWQGALLRRVVSSAAGLGLYKRIWADAGIHPPDIGSVGNLERLPVINKATFRGAAESEYVSVTDRRTLRWQYTSGSTGEPFRFVAPTYEQKYSDFLSFRHMLRPENAGGSFFSNLRLVRIRMSAAHRTNRLFVKVGDFMAKREEAMAKIIGFGGNAIESYPSILVEFCRWLEAHNLQNKLGFKYGFCYGEMLGVAERRYIEKTLSCELFDRYGLEEFGTVASECGKHAGFHLNNESFVLEVVNENGATLPAGARGRVVITDLNNLVMPFIRYDTGDLGRFSDKPCPCGLAAPRFFIEGRGGVIIRLGRKALHYFEFAEIFNDFSGVVLQYQLKINAPDFFEVRIVPAKNFSAENNVQIQERLRALVGGAANFEILEVNSLGHAPGGKQKIVI